MRSPDQDPSLASRYVPLIVIALAMSVVVSVVVRLIVQKISPCWPLWEVILVNAAISCLLSTTVFELLFLSGKSQSYFWSLLSGAIVGLLVHPVYWLR